jgi:hypothetical protein
MIIQGRLTLVTQSEFKEQSKDKRLSIKVEQGEHNAIRNRR